MFDHGTTLGTENQERNRKALDCQSGRRTASAPSRSGSLREFLHADERRLDPPTIADDDIVEATRDLIGILRGMYRAERDSHRRHGLAVAGRELKEALAELIAHPEEGSARRSAVADANAVLNRVFNSMHFNAPLAPVLGAAATRLRGAR